ncbi:transposase family protein [Planosporangium sp. 12N6]|uniref:transposase family protein n=1 Tax=Planosporangium spinosum TaxID=3402278 RepID=UPI003CF9ECBB
MVGQTRQPRWQRSGLTVADGWPIWTSDVRPGREHDTTAVHAHAEILPALRDAGGDLRTLGDLGYGGESDTITVAFKKPQGGRLTLVQQQLNSVHNRLRAIGERGNSLLKVTFKALRNVNLDPGGSGRSSPRRSSSFTSVGQCEHADYQCGSGCPGDGGRWTHDR